MERFKLRVGKAGAEPIWALLSSEPWWSSTSWTGMGAPDCQLLQGQKEPKTKEMRCGSWVWFESWQSFLKETRTLCYIPNCEVRTHKAEPGVCWSRPASAQCPGTFLALSLIHFFWKLQYKAIILRAEPGASRFTAVVLCKSHWRKGTNVHLPPGQSISTFPLTPELFSVKRFQNG